MNDFLCRLGALLIGSLALFSQAEPKVDQPQTVVRGAFVTYEDFGAVGDGISDDLPAICAAHEYANKHKKPVRTKADATYHLGRKALTARIATPTDWGTSKFIIDDSGEVENHKRSLFDVVSELKPFKIEIDRLKRKQQQLDIKPARDALVYVQNSKVKIYKRRGRNQNSGTAQREVFILRSDGTIEGDIIWDYDHITSIKAWPIDPKPLILRGGIFTRIANRMRQEKGYNYWRRNIRIERSNTVVDGLIQHVTGETDVGNPYGGFLYIGTCADITLRNCRIDGHKTYKTIGSAGKPVSMGSYGYSVSLVVNFHMLNCWMDDINDRSRWGVIGSNFMKNMLIEDCKLSRMDVHQGVSGTYIIRRSKLGHQGLNAIGSGTLIVEDSTINGRHFITFRPDYGSTWQGDVVIRNCRWIPNTGSIPTQPTIFSMRNDGTHDFGYPCSMPHSITIDGLFIDDARHPEDYKGILYFPDAIGKAGDERPFPYALTETLRVNNLETASGVTPRLSTNPEMEHKIKLKIEE